MRNLKRALSLALASVMLMGMMVVGSSAAGFPDVSNKDNTEAISVLNAVGVMLGDEDTGNFRPDDNVTRNEMAVILAKLILGKDADKYVGTCPFTDVPTWAQKYVAACYDNKIVAGRTESLYDGNAVVTAQEAAAMVLRVLGYEKLESTGTNWAQPVVAKANELRLFADVGSSASAPLNRNQVAQLSLNALQATMVTSDVEKDIVVEGVVTIPGKVTYTERTTNKFDYTQSTGAYKKDVSDEKLQLCENLYEKDLRLVPGDDSFGRPANIWSYKTDEIVTVAEAADASYIKAVKAEDLYKDLGLKKSTKASVTVDGKPVDNFSITKTGSDKIGGNGVVVDAYKDDDGSVSISVINPYVGEVSKVTEAKGDDARTVTVGGLKFETEGFDVDDVVVYTKADGKIKSMYLAEIVENVEITKTVGSSEFVADGETYKFAANWTKNPAVDVADNTDVKKENKVDLYLDSNDFVVKVKLNEGVTDYAYVIEAGEDSGRYDKGVPYAKLLLSDGTVVEAELNYDDIDLSNVGTQGDSNKVKLGKKFNGQIVEFTKNSKDVYKLTEKGEKKTALTGRETISIETGKAALTLGSAATIYADSKTIFLTDDGDDNYKAYVGYDAVPNLEGAVANGNANAAYAYYCESGSVATVVYVLNATGSSDDIVFLLSAECGDEVKVKDGDNYYECPAVVNGEIVTVKLDTSIKEKNENLLLKSITWANEDEEIISVTKSKAYAENGDNYYVDGTVKKKLTNGNITVGKSSYRVADDAQVFVYSDKIESSSKTAVAAGDSGFFVINDGKVVTIFYKEAGSSDGEDDKNPIDVADITPVSDDWTPVDTEITVSGFEVKKGVELTLDKAVEAVAQKVLKENPTWTRDAGSDTSADGNYTVAFKSNGAKRTAKFALSAVSRAETVKTVESAEELKTALADASTKIIVVNDDMTIPSDTTVSKEIRVAKGATVTVSGNITGDDAKITGEGTVKVTGAVTGASKIETPITLGNGGSIDGTGAPVTVEKNATVTLRGNITEPVTVEEGSKLTLTDEMTKLPEFKGETSKATITIGVELSSGEEDAMSDIINSLGGDKLSIDGTKEGTATLNSKSVKIDADSEGKLTAFNGAQSLKHEFTGSTGSTTGSFYELTLTGLPACKIKGQKYVGNKWVSMNGAFASAGEGRPTDAGDLTVTMLLGNTVTKVKYTVIPNAEAKGDNESTSYDIEITINH